MRDSIRKATEGSRLTIYVDRFTQMGKHFLAAQVISDKKGDITEPVTRQVFGKAESTIRDESHLQIVLRKAEHFGYHAEVVTL